jgi:hypothetical protein
MPTSSPNHFEGREAIQHVVEHHTDGIVASAETHGKEMPGHISSGACAARESGIVILLLWTLLQHVGVSDTQFPLILGCFAGPFLLWRLGRSSLIEWGRLERLHRIIEEERWEIQHHRSQERDELKALYAAKGFEGQLLEDVLDVLMADNDRLLRIMLEEELGLRLGVHEHPLKQGFGAAVGTGIALMIMALGFFLSPSLGILVAALSVMAASAAVAASYEKNKVIPAVIWTIGLAIVTYGSLDLLLDMIMTFEG